MGWPGTAASSSPRVEPTEISTGSIRRPGQPPSCPRPVAGPATQGPPTRLPIPKVVAPRDPGRYWAGPHLTTSKGDTRTLTLLTLHATVLEMTSDGSRPPGGPL